MFISSTIRIMVREVLMLHHIDIPPLTMLDVTLVSIGIAAEYAHPFEDLISASIPTFAGVLITGQFRHALLQRSLSQLLVNDHNHQLTNMCGVPLFVRHAHLDVLDLSGHSPVGDSGRALWLCFTVYPLGAHVCEIPAADQA